MSCGLVIAIIIASCSSGSQSPTPTPQNPTPVKNGRIAHMPQRHRTTTEGTCEKNKGPGEAKPGAGGACKSDADCKEVKDGRCNTRGGGHSLEMNTCEYDRCFADTDCPNGGICSCAGTGNFCMAATCRHDSDCGDGGACSPVPGCFGIESYACHTDKDECIDDDDCRTKDNSSWKACRMQPEIGHWACVPMQCPVG